MFSLRSHADLEFFIAKIVFPYFQTLPKPRSFEDIPFEDIPILRTSHLRMSQCLFGPEAKYPFCLVNQAALDNLLLN